MGRSEETTASHINSRTINVYTKKSGDLTTGQLSNCQELPKLKNKYSLLSTSTLLWASQLTFTHE